MLLGALGVDVVQCLTVLGRAGPTPWLMLVPSCTVKPKGRRVWGLLDSTDTGIQQCGVGGCGVGVLSVWERPAMGYSLCIPSEVKNPLLY